MSSEFYTYEAKSLQGRQISMSEYKGKVVLIVNTASKCGFTPQYEGLENLNKKYKDQGLVILGFPCNQFGKQEPGGRESIEETCQINYGVSFQMFEKIDVNGDKAHPLYQFLRKQKSSLLWNKVKWNFEKFLVDRNGKVVKRYTSLKKPEALTDDIEKYLAQS